MNEPISVGGTVAHVYERLAEAEAAVKRLRAAGFSDVRLSERSGTTAHDHVAPEAGLTEDDFAASLARAGFGEAEAAALTRGVARGGVLLTVAAAGAAGDALAVLRGETVAARTLHPVEPVAAATAQPNLAAVASDPTADRLAVDDPAADRLAASDDLRAPAATDERTIRLRAERLDVSTERETSEARVRREVVTEERTVVVPVRHEELVIERDGMPDVRVPVSDERPEVP